MTTGTPYDAIVLISFGGPEKRADVLPFLDNVLRGRRVPEARKLEVAEHYYHFDGVSPINQLNRETISALRQVLADREVRLPIYFGNRNWDPLLADTLVSMRDDGIKRAMALVTSAFGSYSGCRQYQEDIDAARATVDRAPAVDKLPLFWNSDGFITAAADRLREALDALPTSDVRVAFTAHSIPLSMSEVSPYEAQLTAACEAVAGRCAQPSWDLVYQSRSGPPSQSWLEPDICDHLEAIAGNCSAVVIHPIGFLSDHLEVLYDLDTEAREVCDRLNLKMIRASTVGDHPALIGAFADLIQNHLDPTVQIPSCPVGCCM
jgi:ferrochelatase